MNVEATLELTATLERAERNRMANKRNTESDEAVDRAAHGSASWVKGEAPLKRILMLWNGKALFGPIAFQTEEHRDQETQRLIATTASQIAGAPTHYLIIPKCE